MTQEFRLPPAPVWRSWMLRRCANCAAEGTAGLPPAACWGGGSDCLRFRRSAGLKLYLTLA